MPVVEQQIYLSIPCGFAKEGRFLLGLQLISHVLEEALLLRVAYAYPAGHQLARATPAEIAGDKVTLVIKQEE